MKWIFLLICSLAVFTLSAQDTVLICHQEDVSLFPLANLNTRSIEFSPAYYENGIVYVEAREKQRLIDPKTGKAYLDLMYADIAPDGSTGKPISFSPNIRTQYHEGPCTFNADHTEIFFTRSVTSIAENPGGDLPLRIFHATKGLTDWENIQPLSLCEENYTAANPTLSPDGMYMVFASDMPGGEGDVDLYLTNRLDGDWSTPVNLGRGINTKGKETFPYWHPNGYLIFSSNGRRGMGGLDLYISTWNGHDGFSGIQHLDEPFNSKKDDLGLILNEDGTAGYMASDRKPTRGKDDLYRWESPVSVFCHPPAAPVLIREILVKNESYAPVGSAYVWLIPMNQEGPAEYKEYFNTDLVANPEKDGAFYLKWGVTDTLSTATADAITSANGSATLSESLKSSYILVVQHDGYLPYAEVFPQDLIPGEVILKQAKEIKTECLHVRFAVYNEDGTQKLNGAAITLTGTCLPKTAKAYSDENGLGVLCVPPGCSVKTVVEEEGYATHTFTFTPDEENELWSIYLKSSAGLTAPAAPIASGTVIVIDNIYYDFDKSEIRKGDAGELNALAGILKQYPDLKIELTSHTDTRGTAEYNMELSQRRSASSKNYLVLLGINPARIATKAAGESSPRNHCVDGVPCTEAEHQYNRRTEVRIINPAQGMEIRYKGEG